MFQDPMEAIFRDMLDRGLLIYMDDFLIYSEANEDDIQILLSEVLRRLNDITLALAPDKSVLHASRVEFLGYIISWEGIEMAMDKIETIVRGVLRC
jgi:hypothetical protein